MCAGESEEGAGAGDGGRGGRTCVNSSEEGRDLTAICDEEREWEGEGEDVDGFESACTSGLGDSRGGGGSNITSKASGLKKCLPD